jgi:HPt (histidine-containing phosphotransfer) domain-containing protein
MSDKIIDVEVALQRLGDDKEFLLELLGEFVDQIEETLPELNKALLDREYEQLNAMGHGLKGAAANLNAEAFYTLFKEVEFLGKNQRVGNANEILGKINKSLVDLKEMIPTI